MEKIACRPWWMTIGFYHDQVHDPGGVIIRIFSFVK